jgi:hypothetical protein
MKTFTLTFELNDRVEKPKLVAKSTNEGFSPLELLGLLAWKMEDVKNQAIGNIKPDVVARTLLVTEEK